MSLVSGKDERAICYPRQNYMSDHDILTAALRPAIEAYEAKTAGSSLLGRPSVCAELDVLSVGPDADDAT